MGKPDENRKNKNIEGDVVTLCDVFSECHDCLFLLCTVLIYTTWYDVIGRRALNGYIEKNIA